MTRTSAKTRPIVVTGLLLFATPLIVACGKRPGGSCKGAESTCLDKKTAIVCRRGTFAEVACAGPMGCSKYEDHANCDTSLASASAPCMGEDDEYSCSPDKKRALVCKGDRFEPYLECRGPSGCSILGRTVSCDTSVAATGDPCKTQGAVACGEDQRHMLACRDGRFALQRYCRGPSGCVLKGDTPSCDETLSLAGDPCGVPGQVVCAVDKTMELVCQGGVFTPSLKCKNACTVTNRPGRPIDCH